MRPNVVMMNMCLLVSIRYLICNLIVTWQSSNRLVFLPFQVRVKPNSSEIFASCSVDGSIIIWNISDKKSPLVHKLADHMSYVTNILWIPNTDKLVSASFDHTIKVTRQNMIKKMQGFKIVLMVCLKELETGWSWDSGGDGGQECKGRQGVSGDRGFRGSRETVGTKARIGLGGRTNISDHCCVAGTVSAQAFKGVLCSWCSDNCSEQ